ncbi:OsmC family protein [Nonomuraea ferruginea]
MWQDPENRKKSSRSGRATGGRPSRPGRSRSRWTSPRRPSGTDTGPMPTDYFLGSLASCYALALAWSARKRGIELPDLQVSAVGEYDGPRFKEIRLTVNTSLPIEELEPLLAPASRVCYVSNTLAHVPKIDVRQADICA